MNKPAPKEPSMDEILSSIRQIIADDDASALPARRPAAASGSEAGEPAAFAPGPRPLQPVANASRPAANEQVENSEPPLELSRDQMLPKQPATPTAAEPRPSFEALVESRAARMRQDEPALVDPQDVGFDAAPEVGAVTEQRSEPESQPRSPASSAAMPDPNLSRDLAEQLIDNSTDAAVRHTFARLHSVGIGTQGLTIENMIRDMMRPMLKDWLDENLPGVVERMVEREIARVSRGSDY